MRLPRRIKICGHTFEVRSWPASKMDAPNAAMLKRNEIVGRKYHHYGTMYPDDQLIVVCRDQTDMAKLETFWHECLHAVVEFSGIRADFKHGGKSEEKIVQALGNATMQVLRDNPKLLQLFSR